MRFIKHRPTLDYEVLGQLLEETQLAPVIGLDDGTAIGLGLASAANMLRDRDTASRVIILLTDGAHNADGIAPVDAARRVAALGIRVYTIGIGGSTMPTPVASAGNMVFVENGLDEATLMELRVLLTVSTFGRLTWKTYGLSTIRLIGSNNLILSANCSSDGKIKLLYC